MCIWGHFLRNFWKSKLYEDKILHYVILHDIVFCKSAILAQGVKSKGKHASVGSVTHYYNYKIMILWRVTVTSRNFIAQNSYLCFSTV